VSTLRYVYCVWCDDAGCPKCGFMQSIGGPTTHPLPHVYWRCAHHPVATTNFFERRETCEYGCETSHLRWHDNGDSQLPTKQLDLFQ
jgi:hypothetical protein